MYPRDVTVLLRLAMLDTIDLIGIYARTYKRHKYGWGDNTAGRFPKHRRATQDVFSPWTIDNQARLTFLTLTDRARARS